MKADGRRIKRRLDEIYECGRLPDGTHARVAFSEEDKKGRELFAQYFRHLGLKPYEDEAGNLIARLPGREKNAPAIVVGSHLDTVLDGGKYDGAYGCVAGLEAVEILLKAKKELLHPLEVIVFSDEEGIRFGNGMFGSGAFCGQIQAEDKDTDIYGRTRREVFEAFGIQTARADQARRDPGQVHCTLEVHVEQGGTLDQRGIPIGVVTSIAGVKRFSVTLKGEENHSGSTRMEDRKDALTAAAKVIGRLPDLVKECGGEFTVATVGKLEVWPGAVNVIPGWCEFLLEVRDQSGEVMDLVADRFQEELRESCRKHGVEMSMELVSSHEPGRMNETVCQAAEEACARENLPYLKLPSGAFHDSLLLTRQFAAGMIFVPSVGGISHSPREYTREEDLEKGVSVLLETILQLDQKEGIENESI